MTEARIRLLIVDDEPSTRFSLCQIFSCMGHQVRSAQDGFAALKEMRETRPDVLLSDLHMPHMSGFELLSVVRRRFPEVYVIAMSGAYLSVGVPDGLPADSFYEKATGLSALFASVRQGAVAAEDFKALSATRKAAPVWVAEDTSWGANHTLFLGCPECLRAFPQPRPNPTPAGRFGDALCAHCSTTVRYAVVESVSAAS